jgi:REP element-mobilizing transposase RayT
MSARRKHAAPSDDQLGLALAKPRPRHGGRRVGAGRKPSGRARGLPHRHRPWHDKDQPVHVTLRIRRGIRSLRRFELFRAIRASFRDAAKRGPRSGTFRVCHFSVQTNHLHLIVEAGSKRSLGRGLQGLESSIARRVNRNLGRRGALFADRYHARALTSPLEVRHALLYVATNAAKHPEDFPDEESLVVDGIDPCSSAAWTQDIWARPPPVPDGEPATRSPATWLLRSGWKKHGRLGRSERPAS